MEVADVHDFRGAEGYLSEIGGTPRDDIRKHPLNAPLATLTVQLIVREGPAEIRRLSGELMNEGPAAPKNEEAALFPVRRACRTS
jgi:hypothetical protein